MLLQFEREMLGLYVSDHPLFGLEHVLAAAADSSIALAQTEGADEPRSVTLAGILSAVNRRVTKAGAAVGAGRAGGPRGVDRGDVLPADLRAGGLRIVEDAIVAIKGRTDVREDTVKLIASDIVVLDTSGGPRGPVVVTMAPARCTPPMVDRLKEVLATHPGTTEVHLRLPGGSGEHVLKLGDAYRVAPSPALMGDLKALVGPSAVSV